MANAYAYMVYFTGGHRSGQIVAVLERGRGEYYRSEPLSPSDYLDVNGNPRYELLPNYDYTEELPGWEWNLLQLIGHYVDGCGKEVTEE